MTQYRIVPFVTRRGKHVWELQIGEASIANPSITFWHTQAEFKYYHKAVEALVHLKLPVVY